MDEAIFIRKLNDFADIWYQNTPGTRLILVNPASDVYASLVSKTQAKLADNFDMNVPDWEVYQKVTDKVEFYKLCASHGLDFPKFAVVNEKNYKKAPAKIDYPAVIKPVDSAKYWQLPRFAGYQKVYFVDNQIEAMDILNKVYESGYSGDMLVQEKIESDILGQQDITTYSGKKTKKVQFSQLFQAVLADNNPLSFGVFCALLPTKNTELESKIAKFLNSVGYQGFAGLNILIDPRDNKPKLLELNARLHGESFALTAMGNNPSEILVNDIFGGKFKKTDNEVLWRSVPNCVIRKFVPDTLKVKVKELIRAGKTDTELNYKPDLSPKRRLDYLIYMTRRWRNFRKFSKNENIRN